jgi:hypothetical protein
MMELFCLGSIVSGFCFAIFWLGMALKKILKGDDGVVSEFFFSGCSVGICVSGSLVAFGSREVDISSFNFWVIVFIWAAFAGIANVLYFLPTIVASKRSHSNAVAILALNFLLGWSFFGWVVAMVWALMNARVNVLRVSQPDIPLDDGKVACWKCGRRMSRGFICSDGTCQQCYKPSWSA